jgi:hypothetical protein
MPWWWPTTHRVEVLGTLTNRTIRTDRPCHLLHVPRLENLQRVAQHPRIGAARLDFPIDAVSEFRRPSGNAASSHHRICIHGVVSVVPFEPAGYDVRQTGQTLKPPLRDRLGINQLAVMQVRLPVQHETKDQDNLATARKFVLLVRNRHNLAFDNLPCPLGIDLSASAYVVTENPEITLRPR